MNKCIGCGAVLQNSDVSKEGYIKNNGNLCERCFRIKHYNEYKQVSKTNEDFIPILKDINNTKDLVVLVLDLFNLPQNLDIITNNINNEVLLVLTKRDILPKSIYDENIFKYIDNYKLNYVDKIIISSIKNYNFDLLLEKINKYKKSKNVYVVGFTNAGKSTMINHLIKHYSNLDLEITTSILTSTTLNTIEVPLLDDLTLLDTPGILESGNIIDYLDNTLIKKIIPKKEIKPITYQIKNKQTILIDSICNMEVSNTNLTIYMSNSLNIKRVYKEINNYNKRKIVIDKKNTDIVILGLGFIRIMEPCTIYLDIDDKVKVFTRKSLIGKQN